MHARAPWINPAAGPWPGEVEGCEDDRAGAGVVVWRVVPVCVRPCWTKIYIFGRLGLWAGMLFL